MSKRDQNCASLVIVRNEPHFHHVIYVRIFLLLGVNNFAELRIYRAWNVRGSHSDRSLYLAYKPSDRLSQSRSFGFLSLRARSLALRARTIALRAQKLDL